MSNWSKKEEETCNQISFGVKFDFQAQSHRLPTYLLRKCETRPTFLQSPPLHNRSSETWNTVDRQESLVLPVAMMVLLRYATT